VAQIGLKKNSICFSTQQINDMWSVIC